MLKAAKIRVILFKHQGFGKWMLMGNKRIRNWYKHLLQQGFNLPEIDV